MNRRTALATAGSVLTFTVTGCLGGGDEPGNSSRTNGSVENGSENDVTDGNDSETNGTEGDHSEIDPNEGNGSEYSIEDRTYEECHLVSIEYEWLPEDVKQEVDVALDEEQYESDGLLFAEVINPDRSYLVVDGVPYDPIVEVDDGKWTLELHEAEVVRAPEPRLVAVRNSADRDHEIRVELTGEETLVDETVSVAAGEERKIEATDEFGRYELTAEALTGHGNTESSELEVSDSAFGGIIEVTDTGVWISQTVADIVPCSWDATRSGSSRE